MAANVAERLRLLLVTDDRLLGGRDLPALARAAVRGGVTAVELRLKGASPRELLAAARALVRLLPVPVLVNDRVDVAIAAGAAGAHVGADDLPIRFARRAAPPGFLLGASVGEPGEIEPGRGADYWGVGPWRVTTTKPEAGQALGAEGFRSIVLAAGGTPCIAIGGVTPADVAAVLAAGGSGVAVAAGILTEEDLEAAARRYAEAFGPALG
ncbi:MAG: thiamine phosphate synthase [Gemmatimonadales bacterium]